MGDNQKVTESLLKVILLCGKQDLALHRHWDDHIDWEEEDYKSANEGNLSILEQRLMIPRKDIFRMPSEMPDIHRRTFK